MSSTYSPPYTLTPRVLALVAEVGEALGRLTGCAGVPAPPALRRGNRLRTIQASLAIENNSLTLEQVTAVIAGKRVLGPPKEIQEVAFARRAWASLRGKRSCIWPRLPTACRDS